MISSTQLHQIRISPLLESVLPYTYKFSALFKLILLCAVLSGCVYNVPLAVDPYRDMSRAFPHTRKIPAKVGLYIGDDLKKYVYRQQKMGMTFQMKAGEYVPLIGLRMASTMFENVIPVNSLPPYGGNYRPDVEAVVEPEVLYSYGNAVGTLSGYIEGKVKIRITAYDLDGKIRWQDEAFGDSRSREISFVDSFLGGMEKVGEIGYQAAFAAAVKIINNFNARPPKELYALLEIKGIAASVDRRNVSSFELFKAYYVRGRFEYDEKNYYQALYLLEKAFGLNPSDPSTLFYIGRCLVYTGNKTRAIETFTKVIEMHPNSQEAAESRKWLKILREPLKIAVVGLGSADNVFFGGLLHRALADSGFYELTEVSDLTPPTSPRLQNEWNAFLERCTTKGIKAVIVSDIDGLSQKVRVGHLPPGDLATEHRIKISSKLYSVKKKDVRADIKITDKTTTISEQSQEAERGIRGQLLTTGAQKLVRRFLEHDIY